MPSEVSTPPVYATLAELGDAIQSGRLDQYFYIKIDDDLQHCRLRYLNPNYNDNQNDDVNLTCPGLFQWVMPDPKIFDQCVSFGIRTKPNPLITGEALL